MRTERCCAARVRCLHWHLLQVAAIALLVACATPPSLPPLGPQSENDISHRALTNDGVRHYPLALGQTSIGAVPLEHPAPSYPPALLAERPPPQEIEALLLVDAQGKVREVRIANDTGGDPRHRLFAEAVREAVMQWTFLPLRISQWAADANGETHEVGSKTQPFSVNYVFRFAWKGGASR